MSAPTCVCGHAYDEHDDGGRCAMVAKGVCSCNAFQPAGVGNETLFVSTEYPPGAGERGGDPAEPLADHDSPEWNEAAYIGYLRGLRDAAKAVCAGCRDGLPLNDGGLHELPYDQKLSLWPVCKATEIHALIARAEGEEK